MRASAFLGFVVAAALLATACGSSSQGGSDAGSPTAPSVTPTPSANLAFSTTASRGWSSIDVSVDGQYIGGLSRYLFSSSESASSCTAVADARVVVAVTAGSHSYSARTNNGGTWSGSATLSSGGCREVVLSCSNDDCSR